MGIEFDLARDDNRTTFELGKGGWWDFPRAMPDREGLIDWIIRATGFDQKAEWLAQVADLMLAFAPPGTPVRVVNDADDSFSYLLDAADEGRPYTEVGTRYTAEPHGPRPYAGYEGKFK